MVDGFILLTFLFSRNMVPLMDKNILLNKLEDTVYADLLD